MNTLRPPTEDDAAEVARLRNEHWPERVDPAGVLVEWSSPSVDLARDARIGEGTFVLVDKLGEERAWIDVQGRPATEALDWAEARVRELDLKRAFAGGWSTNTPLLEALEARDYKHARSSWRMETALGSEARDPESAVGIAIRSLGPGEERIAYDVHQESFEDTWEPIRWSYEQWSYAYLERAHYEPSLWFLAWDGSEACGVAICHVHSTDPDLGWVAVLAVRREWRRRGIGRALLAHAFRAFAERGLIRAGLGVDSDNPSGAHKLYGEAGLRATRQFEIYEKAFA